MNIAFSRKELAEIVGYSYHGLYNIDKALPKDRKLFVEAEGEGRKCDLAIFVQRWIQYKVEYEVGDETTLEDEKARHEKLKADKTEIELGRMKGEYVSITEVEKLWMDVTGIVVNRLVNLPKRLATQLIMIDNADAAEEILERDLRSALDMISNTPLPGESAPPTETEVDADDA